jgi:tetratricopeptide (TPR) repeat protein
MAATPPSATTPVPRARRLGLEVAIHLVIALVIAVAFARLRDNGPVWDDQMLTVDNPYLRSWSGLRTLVTTDIWTASAKGEPSRFYRPLTMVSYLVDAQLFGASARVFHAVNLALHVVNAWLLLAVLRGRQLARGLALPVAVVLAFALAPVDVEAVVWISGRFDLLGTTLVLAALCANRRGTRAGAVATTALLGLALLCKESFVLGAALVVLDDVLIHRRPIRGELGKYAAFASAVGAFLALRKLVGVISVGAITGTGLTPLAQSYAFLLATYAGALVHPVILDPFRPYAPFGSAATLGVLALTLALVLAALAWLRRGWREGAEDPRPGAVAMGLGWTLLGFLPVTLTGPNLDMVGDRYAYFPLLGVFLAVCPLASLAFEAALSRGAGARPLLAASAVLGIAALGAEASRTRTRILDWRDERTLFQASLRDDPGNAYALYSLGFLEVTEESDLAAGEAHLLASLAVRPTAFRALDAMCYVRLQQRRLESADTYCRQSITSNPNNPRAWVNLASVHLNEHDWKGGIVAATRAIDLKPKTPEPYYVRASCLANLGDGPGARRDLGAALALDPTHRGALDLSRQLDAAGVP